MPRGNLNTLISEYLNIETILQTGRTGKFLFNLTLLGSRSKLSVNRKQKYVFVKRPQAF